MPIPRRGSIALRCRPRPLISRCFPRPTRFISLDHHRPLARPLAANNQEVIPRLLALDDTLNHRLLGAPNMVVVRWGVLVRRVVAAQTVRMTVLERAELECGVLWRRCDGSIGLLQETVR